MGDKDSVWMYESLLPPREFLEEEEILEALEQWGRQKDERPGHHDLPPGSYWLRMYDKDSHPHPNSIQVILKAKCFVTRLFVYDVQDRSPEQVHMTYFSFCDSPDFPNGPVEWLQGGGHGPLGSGGRVVRGYNHKKASVAYGEARIMAGWFADPWFAVNVWARQFKHSQHGQEFPPAFIHFISSKWPDMANVLESLHLLEVALTSWKWLTHHMQPLQQLERAVQLQQLGLPGIEDPVTAGAVPGEAPDEEPGQDAGEEPEEEPHSAGRCKLCIRDGVLEDEDWVNGFCPQCLANPLRERISFW